MSEKPPSGAVRPNLQLVRLLDEAIETLESADPTVENLAQCDDAIAVLDRLLDAIHRFDPIVFPDLLDGRVLDARSELMGHEPRAALARLDLVRRDWQAYWLNAE